MTSPGPLPDPIAYQEALGRTIQVLRTDRSMSRRELAERSSISYSYLSAIENGGKPPSAKILTLISNALGVHAHELMAAAEARAAEGRFTGADPESAEAAAIDSSLERHELRRLEREAREMRSAQAHAIGATPPRSDLGAMAELRGLIARMGPEDVEILLQLARRLAGGRS